jgi:tetratricopeptide (TPR) repeat protein
MYCNILVSIGLVIVGIYSTAIGSSVPALYSEVATLRNSGLQSIKNKNFAQAIKYYESVLQLVEGKSGDFSADMRRRCGLTLAECELRCGQFERSIARCSEVIDEGNNELILQQGISPKLSKSKKNLVFRQSMATAHYRRGVALQRLVRLELAKLDFNTALQFKPKDKKIRAALASVKKAHSKLLKSGQTIVTNGDCVKEQLLDFVEECQCNFPRQVDIQTLQTKSLQLPLSKSFGGLSIPGFSFDSFSKLESMIAPLSSITGVDQSKLRLIFQVLKFASRIYIFLKKSWEFVSKRLELFIGIFGLLWIVVAALKHSEWSQIVTVLQPLRSIFS